ncbi:MAG: hypothetical protein Q8M56_03770, partial [Desulfobacterales bacterium]|nr:hypothetical protein [Desulfobacterales bacterium]
MISEQQKYVETYKSYSGSGSTLTFNTPATVALAGPLPDYIPVTLTHNTLSYNLGTSTLTDGDHTVMANRYSAVIGGVGDNIIHGAGFAYGGTGNARLIGGEILMAGNGDQYLENGRTMVVGDGRTTVAGKALGYIYEVPHYGSYVQRLYEQPDTRILIDPNNTGMDLLVSDDNSQTDRNNDWIDDSVEAIYRGQGIRDARESYQYGGKFFVGSEESYGGYHDTLEDARRVYSEVTGSDALAGWAPSYYVKPLPVLLKSLTFDAQEWGPASSYYATYPLQTVMLTANSFAALQPYLDAGLLPMKTVHFG